MRKTAILAALTALLGVSCAFAEQGLQTALFAGGSFWSLQDVFEKPYGVISVEAGYAGGTSRNPTPATFAKDGAMEAVLVTFAPDRVGYAELLDLYWRSVDPTDSGGQFTDRGPQYAPEIFWANDAQRKAAEASLAALVKSGRFSRPIAVKVEKAPAFHKAPGAEQDYALGNPAAYAAWLSGSGRQALLAKTWGMDPRLEPAAPPSAMNGRYAKPSKEQLMKTLTAMQYQVTQEDGTEPPFDNTYWNNHKEGIYVDIVSGEPLFSSRDKFESGTGWPSFTMPLAPQNVVTRTDRSFGMVRTEVRSRWADSHLGHLFNDGPAPTGLRYCMDSAALRFVPVADMAKEGYGRYLPLFSVKN